MCETVGPENVLSFINLLSYSSRRERNIRATFFSYASKVSKITNNMAQKVGIKFITVPPHLVRVHDLHDALLEELRVNLAGDGRRLLHQAQLSVFLHRHRVRDHGADVRLRGRTQSKMVTLYSSLQIFTKRNTTQRQLTFSVSVLPSPAPPR